MQRPTLLTALLLAAVVAGPAGAQTPPPPVPPEEPRIASGVTVAGIAVGGLTRDEAAAVVQAAFDEPLPFTFRSREWSVKPATLGSYPYLNPALNLAMKARPNAKVRLNVRLHLGKIRRYGAYLDRVFARAPQNSRLLLRGLRPYLTKAKAGLDVNTGLMTTLITGRLERTDRRAIPLQTSVLRPTVTRTSFGPIIVIRRGSRRLYLYRNMNFVRRFSIAVGMSQYPTPLGRYHVVIRERHPTWDPPSSPWAAGLGPVPPGPENPLGTRWIGTSAPGIGIHGTPQPWTVGTAASHGCIRMYMSEVEWLFERVRVGSPVLIVSA